MPEKDFPIKPRRKAVTLIRHRSISIVIGVGAFLLFIGETVGTVQELPTDTIGPYDHASRERSGLIGISDPATATQNGQATASPGQWLIDDVARERAESEPRKVNPRPVSATNAARNAAHVEAKVGLPSSDDTRAGGDKRPEEVTSSIDTPTAEDGGLGAPTSQRALKRSDGDSPRPDTPRRRDGSLAKCTEGPVGPAPKDYRWSYHLDRETHRKCWHVRAFKEDGARRRIVESDRRLSERPSPEPLDSAWAWWYWW
jgi:hypothetical protein